MDFIDTDAFARFIEEKDLFSRAKASMFTYLENYYEDSPDEFTDYMGDTCENVKNNCTLTRGTVSVNRNYRFDPPLDTISVSIAIENRDPDHFCLRSYRILYDLDLAPVDDFLD